MINRLIRFFSRMSRFFHWDLLWRISRSLSLSDRSHLTLRLLQKNDVDLLTFRRDQTLWTAYGWDMSVTWSLLAQGHFQGEQIQSLVDWMRYKGRFTPERDLIVDVGANIGTTCIPFAQKTDCHIIAIEPFPENFFLLQRNSSQNGLDGRITCVKKAIFGHAETIFMELPEGRCGGARIRQPRDVSDTTPGSAVKRVVEVPADGLFNIITEKKYSPEQIAFVWCDIEGSEAELIKSGTALWSVGVPLYLEIYPEALSQQGSLDAFKALLVANFDRFIKSADLVAQGAEAFECPIAEIASLIDHLDKKNDLTDVLLLPKKND